MWIRILPFLLGLIPAQAMEVGTPGFKSPVNAPLIQNQTKVPLREPCNNVTTICWGEFMDCRDGKCKCQVGYAPRPDNADLCGPRIRYNVDIQTDPTMIGVVIGLVLMSVTLCVVLRLFAKARFRENRTIFNQPNPRLMNVSLMKSSKQFLRGNSGTASGRRRGSGHSITGHGTPGGTAFRIPTGPTGSIPIKNETIDETRGRGRALRSQMSTDTTGGVETPTSSGARFPKSKYRQDSVTSNPNV